MAQQSNNRMYTSANLFAHELWYTSTIIYSSTTAGERTVDNQLMRVRACARERASSGACGRMDEWADGRTDGWTGERAKIVSLQIEYAHIDMHRSHHIWLKAIRRCFMLLKRAIVDIYYEILFLLFAGVSCDTGNYTFISLCRTQTVCPFFLSMSIVHALIRPSIQKFLLIAAHSKCCETTPITDGDHRLISFSFVPFSFISKSIFIRRMWESNYNRNSYGNQPNSIFN